MATDRRETLLVSRPSFLSERAAALVDAARTEKAAGERQAAAAGERFERKVAGTLRIDGAGFFARLGASFRKQGEANPVATVATIAEKRRTLTMADLMTPAPQVNDWLKEVAAKTEEAMTQAKDERERREKAEADATYMRGQCELYQSQMRDIAAANKRLQERNAEVEACMRTMSQAFVHAVKNLEQGTYAPRKVAPVPEQPPVQLSAELENEIKAEVLKLKAK